MNDSKECSLAFLLIVLVPAIFVQPLTLDRTTDLIEDTCQKTPEHDLCTSIIRPDPRSAAAKGPGDLGIIVLDQVDKNAQETITKITPLINQASDPNLKRALSSCNEGYITIVSEWVPLTKDSFNRNSTEEAFKNMVSASQVAVRCEDGFKGLGPSPLTYLNYFTKMSAIVCASIAKGMQ